ncbi:unnamed protein product [Diamesa tonsa]
MNSISHLLTTSSGNKSGNLQHLSPSTSFGGPLEQSAFKDEFFGVALTTKQQLTNKIQSTCPYIQTETAYQEKSTVVEYKPYTEVPGPKPIPVLGNTWRFAPVIGQFKIGDIAKMSFVLQQVWGECVAVRGLIGRPDLLFVYNADEIEKCYRNEGPTPFRPSMPSLVKYKGELRKEFFGELPGVVGVHGEQWREFRSRVQKPILQIKTVKRYVKPLESVTSDFLTRCMSLLDDKCELPADFDNEIHKWSLECIGLVALDTRLGCLSSNIAKDSEPQHIINAARYALRNIANLELKAPYWRWIPTPMWTRYVNNMDYFVEICMKYISKATERLKISGGEGGALDGEPSLIERVLKQEKNEKLATVMALDLMLVGIDTISMAVSSILYQLATRPEEQQKIYEELERNMPDPNEPLTFELLDKNTYTKAFIKEVLRIYSTVIGNGRTLQQDTPICGYMIPKGVQVVFPNLVTGTMEKYVTDPNTFKPARWIKSEENDDDLHRFASLPYGHGSRMCIGRRFADLEMQILLAKLVRNYKLEFKYPPLKYSITFMYAPDGDLKFKMTPREHMKKAE